MFCTEILQKSSHIIWNWDLSLWKNTAYNGRSLSLPAAAKKRNFRSTPKLELSFSALKDSVLNCAWSSVSVAVLYPYKCLLKQVGWSFQNSKLSIQFVVSKLLPTPTVSLVEKVQCAMIFMFSFLLITHQDHNNEFFVVTVT